MQAPCLAREQELSRGHSERPFCALPASSKSSGPQPSGGARPTQLTSVLPQPARSQVSPLVFHRRIKNRRRCKVEPSRTEHGGDMAWCRWQLIGVDDRHDDWGIKFRAFLKTRDVLVEALRSAYALRNSITHGGSGNRGLRGVEELYKCAKEVVGSIGDLSQSLVVWLTWPVNRRTRRTSPPRCAAQLALRHTSTAVVKFGQWIGCGLPWRSIQTV